MVNYPLMRMRLLLVLFCCCLSGSLATGSDGKCRCRAVPDGASSFGGNEVGITQTGIKLSKQIRGKLTYGFNGNPVKGGIIELFALKHTDADAEAWRIPGSRHRVAACYTDERGRFCLDGIRSGRYLLRAGTNKQESFNHMHIIIKLNRNSGKRAGSELEIYLRPAT